ncbi:hypothetical protein MoryE10_03310 [Methylogaea oryzae]|uniref:Uncharacterized protein n=2 Tax=Methylogaea oryzae TaxID=1295382 RepID=A0A8D4VL16_9GAMM|nr:hypothetical protein MoryE10_03310 [Methylogaea oryzae]
MPSLEDVAAIPDDQLRKALYQALVDLAMRYAMYDSLHQQFVAMERDSNALRQLVTLWQAGQIGYVGQVLGQLAGMVPHTQDGRALTETDPARLH